MTVALTTIALGAALITAVPPIGDGTPMATTAPDRTGTAVVEGAELYFEVRGDGPPLLMIPGAGGDAGFYTYPATLLADRFQVITYDRRAMSRSTGTANPGFSVAQQADDAVAVLRAAGHESGHVFGNSAGGIIALDMASRHPGAVRSAVIHEPPIIELLPDAERWRGMFAAVHRTGEVLGPAAAQVQFTLSIRAVPISTYPYIPADFNNRVAGNQEFFVEHEMLGFVSYQPDLAAVAEGGVDISVAAGRLTLDTGDYYGRTAVELANRLGTRPELFPGHHLSYFDMPVEWSTVLRDLLESAS